MKKVAVFLAMSAFLAETRAQYFAPAHLNMVVEKTRGGTYMGGGFLPFKQSGELREVFNGGSEGVSHAFKQLQQTSIGWTADSIHSNSVFVDALSFIPNASVGRLSIGTMLAFSELSAGDSGNTEAYESLAMQKMLNGGGTFNVNFSRPLLYIPFSESVTNYVISNVGITLFSDIGRLTQNFDNPGLGAQFITDFDLRLLSNFSELMIGNLFRLGARGRFLVNAFNAKYSKENAIDKSIGNLMVLICTGYLGVGPFSLEVNYNISNNQIFDGRRMLFKLNLMPVKF